MYNGVVAVCEIKPPINKAGNGNRGLAFKVFKIRILRTFKQKQNRNSERTAHEIYKTGLYFVAT